MTQKLCYECKHMYLCAGGPGYSELTPGMDMSMGCYENHWDYTPYYTSKQDLRALLTSAAECPDYVPDPDMIAIGKRDERTADQWGISWAKENGSCTKVHVATWPRACKALCGHYAGFQLKRHHEQDVTCKTCKRLDDKRKDTLGDRSKGDK